MNPDPGEWHMSMPKPSIPPEIEAALQFFETALGAKAPTTREMSASGQAAFNAAMKLLEQYFEVHSLRMAQHKGSKQ